MIILWAHLVLPALICCYSEQPHVILDHVVNTHVLILGVADRDLHEGIVVREGGREGEGGGEGGRKGGRGEGGRGEGEGKGGGGEGGRGEGGRGEGEGGGEGGREGEGEGGEGEDGGDTHVLVIGVADRDLQ